VATTVFPANVGHKQLDAYSRRYVATDDFIVVCNLCSLLSNNYLYFSQRTFDFSTDQRFWQNESVAVVTATKAVSKTLSSTDHPFNLAGAYLKCFVASFICHVIGSQS